MFHGHHRIEVHLSEYQQPVEAEQGLNLEALILLRILTLHWPVSLAAGLDGIKRKLTPGKRFHEESV